MVRNKIELKSSIQYDSQKKIVVKSANNVRVTIAIPDSKVVYSEIISVPPYRKVSKSELFADEVIINNIVKRKKTRALMDKIVKKTRKALFPDRQKIVTNN